MDPLEIALPEDKEHDEQNTDDEECDDVYEKRRPSAHCWSDIGWSVLNLRRTSSLPAVGGNATIAETEDDENETGCDEEGPNPVYTPVTGTSGPP